MKILEEFGITPNKIKLYEQALTHTSYANEHNCPSYERLEYLGDAVLELVMSTYLFKNTTYPEGRMTKLRASYVCENALYEYSLKLRLNEYIRLGHGESENGGRMRKAIVADTFEAFIAAMYLDQGLDVVNNFIKHYIIPLIEKKELNFEQDYKSILQEFVQTDKRTLNYVVVDESGPAHDKTFTIIVKIDDIIYGRGTAHSKKEAEQLAAKNALEKAQNS